MFTYSFCTSYNRTQGSCNTKQGLATPPGMGQVIRDVLSRAIVVVVDRHKQFLSVGMSLWCRTVLRMNCLQGSVGSVRTLTQFSQVILEHSIEACRNF